MSILAQRLDPVAIRAQSPDKTVRASFSYREGLSVRIKSGTISSSSPESLAEQISETINRAARGFTTAADKVFQREYGAETLERLEATRQGRELRPFLDALPGVSATATGPRGAVAVTWEGESCRVTVRDKAMFAGESAVSQDVNEALVFAQAHYTTKAAELYSRLVEDA